MTTAGMSGAPLQLKLFNPKTEEYEWLTIGVHVGFEKMTSYATLITDDVYLNFILPMIEKFYNEFGRIKGNKWAERDILD